MIYELVPGKKQWQTIRLAGLSGKPAALPEVRTPGLDPRQVLVLLRSLRWQSCLRGGVPATVQQGGRQRTVYQVGLVTRCLAGKLSGADARWLRALAAERHGSRIGLEIGLRDGRIHAVSTSLPLQDGLTASQNAKAEKFLKQMKVAMPAGYADITVTFDYHAHVGTIRPPEG